MKQPNCPIRGCESPRGNRYMPLCRKHWFMVPEELRQSIWAAVVSPLRVEQPIAELIEQAIAHVQALETDQPALFEPEAPCPT